MKKSHMMKRVFKHGRTYAESSTIGYFILVAEAKKSNKKKAKAKFTFESPLHRLGKSQLPSTKPKGKRFLILGPNFSTLQLS